MSEMIIFGAMKTLQEKVGVDADGSFGPNTARAIAKHYDLSANHGAHLLGQAHHESGGFKKTTESLYYSTPERIQAVWPTRFETIADAEPYAKNSEKLADKVYGGRMGNNGEGFKWRGRGYLMITVCLPQRCDCPRSWMSQTFAQISTHSRQPFGTSRPTFCFELPMVASLMPSLER
jgi:hypothetical protein